MLEFYRLLLSIRNIGRVVKHSWGRFSDIWAKEKKRYLTKIWEYIVMTGWRPRLVGWPADLVVACQNSRLKFCIRYSISRARYACSRYASCYSLYICLGPSALGMGESYVTKIKICHVMLALIKLESVPITSNYPSKTVETTFLGQSWNLFTF